MIPHSDAIEEILQQLGVEPEQGLSSDEASRRLQEYGPNQLKAKPKRSLFKRFLDQFKDVMIVILIIAAIISL